MHRMITICNCKHKESERKLLSRQYTAISRQYTAISRQYTAISRQYTAISRQYTATLAKTLAIIELPNTEMNL